MLSEADFIAKWGAVSFAELQIRSAELVEDMRQAGRFIHLSVPATPDKVTAFFKMFKCQRCQDSCCLRETVKGIILVGSDCDRIAGRLGISARQFKVDYTYTDKRGRLLKSPCPFFVPGEEVACPGPPNSPRCSIFPDYPNVCRLYPVNQPGKQLMVNPTCPGGRRVAAEIIKYQASLSPAADLQ